MKFLGGGERLCCETIRALLSMEHEITLLSAAFDSQRIETFFGYDGLFKRVRQQTYSRSNQDSLLGTTSHLLHHARGQSRALRKLRRVDRNSFDLIFSTQDPGYIPDLSVPVLQWGYFPRYFPGFRPGSIIWTIASLPSRLYHDRKISRIGLVLAISQYSKQNLDASWKRPSVLAYPSCNMVSPRTKRNLVVTVGRAVPIKRLEIFWEVASLCPEYEFAMLLTRDPSHVQYSDDLAKLSPPNGQAILDPPKETYHQYLGEAKVYLHLMEDEHFGITIVEAMSAACVPIVHDSGGPREIVDGETGFRWRSKEEIPSLIREASKMSPSAASRLRARDFRFETFEKRLSKIFSVLHV